MASPNIFEWVKIWFRTQIWCIDCIPRTYFLSYFHFITFRENPITFKVVMICQMSKIFPFKPFVHENFGKRANNEMFDKIPFKLFSAITKWSMQYVCFKHIVLVWYQAVVYDSQQKCLFFMWNKLKSCKNIIFRRKHIRERYVNIA